MNDALPGNVPFRPATDNPTGARPRIPTRALLSSGGTKLYRKGESDKADLLLNEAGVMPVIVKDYRNKTAWVRAVGRWMIGREARAYARLAGVQGVPRWVGRIDAHALAIEYVDAVPLAFSPERTENGAAKLRQLRSILDAMHRAGVAHLDLRGRENVLLDRAGRLWIVDFASAVCLRPGGRLYRWAFRWLAMADEAAYLKWKSILEAGPFTDEEQAFFRRFRALRPLWLHRRRAWRGKTKPRA